MQLFGCSCISIMGRGGWLESVSFCGFGTVWIDVTDLVGTLGTLFLRGSYWRCNIRASQCLCTYGHVKAVILKIVSFIPPD